MTFHERKAKRTKLLGKKLKTCLACNGSGYYDHDGSPKCSSCNGTGKIRES